MKALFTRAYLTPMIPVLLILFLQLTPAYLWACEPILPLANLTSPVSLVPSLVFLFATILFKCSAFTMFQDELRWYQAVVFMLLANLVSSLVGLLVSMASTLPALLFVGLPVVFLMSLRPARRLLFYFPVKCFGNWGAEVMAALVTVMLFSTWILFGAGQYAINKRQYVEYWGLKLAYVYIALTISMGLTTFWEEAVVSGLAKHTTADRKMLVSVTKANLLTYLFIVTVAAIKILPARLHSPGFLAHLGIFWNGD